MSLTIHLSYRRAVSEIATITHNLNNMAGEANAHTLIWHPGQAGISKARQMIKPLTKVLASALWNYFRDDCCCDTGDKIRLAARRALPRAIVARWFN